MGDDRRGKHLLKLKSFMSDWIVDVQKCPLGYMKASRNDDI